MMARLQEHSASDLEEKTHGHQEAAKLNKIQTISSQQVQTVTANNGSSLQQHGSNLTVEQAGSDLEEGIHGETVTVNQASSLHQYGSNLIFFREVITILFLCYPDLLMMLIHGLEEGWNYGAIFPPVVYIALLVMLYKKAKVSKISSEAFTDYVGVLRDELVQYIPISLVVVDDILFLKTGDKVPVDGLFIRGSSSLKLDDDDDNELPVDRSQFPLIFAGATVVEGHCYMSVTAVGENTRESEMMRSTGSCNINHKSQLQIKVDRLDSNMKKVATAFSLVIFVVLLLYYYFIGNSATEDGENNDDHVPKGKKVTMAQLLREAERIIKKQGGAASQVAGFSSVVLVSVGSGLLTGVLISLLCSQKKMELAEACATTGCINTICTSKTSDLWRFSFNNIQKFIQFHLTITLAGHIVNFIAAIATAKIFLSQFQIWWVSLIGDPFGAFALSTDPPSSAPPASPTSLGASSLISKAMWRNIVFQALYQATMTQVLHFIAIAIIHVDETEVSAMILNSFALCQVFALLNTREIEKKNVFENMHKNHCFLVVVVFMVVLQVMFMCFNPELSLDLLKWCICIGISALSLPIGWVVKYIPVPASA